MSNKWEVIHEGDTDSGKHTSWALEINHPVYGKYVWISGYLDSDEETILEYRVSVCLDNEFEDLKTCKSLSSAKR